MGSTYSKSLRLELPGAGDQAGVWGLTNNNNLSAILDAAIAGLQTVSITSTAQVLTYADGPASEAFNQAVYATLKFTNATANTSVFAPPVPKQYIVWNNTNFTITVYNSTVIGNTTPAGAGVAIATGNKVLIWSDGTNFYEVQAQNLTGVLPLNKGGTGQTTQQAALNALVGSLVNNRVLRSDGVNVFLDSVDLATDVVNVLDPVNGGTGVSAVTGTGNSVRAISPQLSGTIGLGTNWAVVESGGVLYYSHGGNNKISVDSVGNISDIAGNVRSLPLNTQGAAYVLTASDNGKVISISAGGLTVNNSVMSASMVVTIHNDSSSSIPITQGSGVTLRWAGQTTPTTGSRTLGPYGLATIVFLSASVGVITGAGLT